MIRKVALLAVAGSLALTGCGAGTSAESTKPTQLTEGVNLSQNGIDVRHLFVLGPAPGTKLPVGSSLAVYGTLINSGSSASDALTGVSVAGGAVQLGAVKGGAVELPLHKAVNLAQAGAQPSAQPTPAAPTGTAPSAGAEQDGGAAVVLKGTTKVITPGEYLRLTLQFRNAQAITVNVQVIPAKGEYATLPPATTAAPSPAQAPASEAAPGEQAGDHTTGVEVTPASVVSKKPGKKKKD